LRWPILTPADETHHLGHALDQVPGVIVHFHFHKHVGGEELALAASLHALAHLHDIFGGDQHLTEHVLHLGALDALFQRALDDLLEARVGMHHIPLLGHQLPPLPIRWRTIQPNTVSMMNSRIEATTVSTITTSVVCTVSLRVGQTTFRRSTSASRRKKKKSRPRVV